MRNLTREFIVGIVFFLLLGALGVITFKLSRDVFASSEEATFRFEDVGGLTEGSEVWINGLPSGTVKSVAISQDGTITATAKMRNRLGALDLTRGATVEVKEKSSLGGAVISVTTLKALDPKAPHNPEELTSRVWPAKAGGFAAVGRGAVDEFVKSAEDSPAFLGKALVGKEGVENFNAAISEVRSLVTKVNKWADDVDAGKGALSVLLRDEETGKNMKATIARLEEITRKASEGEGLLAKLLSDKGTSDKFDKVLSGFETLSDGLQNKEGSLYKLLNDGSLFEDAKATAANLKEFSAGLNDEKGTVYKLLHDEKMADDFQGFVTSAKGAFDDLKSVLGDVKSGKGTLGKLVSDESLYTDVKDAVRSIQRSFEEARENAPILTFAGFLFRAF